MIDIELLNKVPERLKKLSPFEVEVLLNKGEVSMSEAQRYANEWNNQPVVGSTLSIERTGRKMDGAPYYSIVAHSSRSYPCVRKGIKR